MAIFLSCNTLYKYIVCKKGAFVMTNPIFNPQPNYSGVTIQIANPSVNVSPQGVGVYPGGVQNPLMRNGNYIACPQACYYDSASPVPQIQEMSEIQGATSLNPTDANTNANSYSMVPNNYPNAYPAQYYLNNYNYGVNGNGNGNLPDANQAGLSAGGLDGYNSAAGNNGRLNNSVNNRVSAKEFSEDNSVNNDSGYSKSANAFNNQDLINSENMPDKYNSVNKPMYANEDGEYPYSDRNHDMNSYRMYADSNEVKPSDMSTSKEIISDLDDREAKIQEQKKNSKETRIVALTDEYIKSLENYLNNPNNEIRLMASKEILTRLDEDKDRYNDAALNALLNKMLQDPSKTVRVAALSAFASQLASGNDYTVQLLHNIQSNPDADKEDVLQAADILLKMSAGVEVKNIPNPKVKEEKQQ